MRNNLDGDATKSYRMNTQFMFECVLRWLQGRIQPVSLGRGD